VLTAIGEQNAEAGIKIYPNPAGEEFIVSGFSFKNRDEISVTDALGKILYSKIFSSPTSDFRLPTSNFDNGIYFLNVQTEKARVTGKVVVQH